MGLGFGLSLGLGRWPVVFSRTETQGDALGWLSVAPLGRRAGDGMILNNVLGRRQAPLVTD